MTTLRAALIVGLVAVAACSAEGAPMKQIAVGKTTSALYTLPPVLWPNPGNIPVCWETPGFAQEKEWTKQSFADSWTKNNPAIKFTGFGTCAANAPGIHVMVRSGGDGPQVTGFGKELDGKAGGMILDFTFANDPFYATCLSSETRRKRCIESIAIHEMGHALGFLHEHERLDTPTSCEHREPISDGTSKTHGAYDVMSIMNYCYPDRDNVYPTLLSPGDIAGSLESYPPPKVTAPTKPAETNDGTTTPQADNVGDPSDGDDDEDDTSASDADNDDADDDTATPKKKKPKKKSTATPPAGCNAAAGPVDPSSAVWILAVFAAVRRRRRA